MAFDPWTYADKTNSEQSHQRALFMWANMAMMFGKTIADDPLSYTKPGFAKTQFENAGKLGYKLENKPVLELKWLHAIHNQGHGDKIRGNAAKAEGVKSGVSDIMLPVKNISNWLGNGPAPNFCGLYIELKKPTFINLKGVKVYAGKPSKEQLEFQQFVTNQGYKAVICEGWKLAKDEIVCYLNL